MPGAMGRRKAPADLDPLVPSTLYNRRGRTRMMLIDAETICFSKRNWKRSREPWLDGSGKHPRAAPR